LLFVLIAVALLFDFTNGSNDVSNIIATAVSSRAINQRTALAMLIGAVFIAPFLFGVAVASTLGKGLVDPAVITLEVVLSAVIAAIAWNLATRHFGIPSSSSHALIGGLLGASIIGHGIGVVQLPGLGKVLLGLFVSPLLGLLVGFFFTKLVLLLTHYQSTRINNTFKRLQFFTLLCLALSYGTNDAQKTMGIITLGLVTAGVLPVFHVPVWVILSCAAAISLGAAFGGWRLIRTLGGRIYRIRPMNAFASQLSAAVVILSAASSGIPVSSTHVISTTILGSGAAERPNKIRWQIGRDMLITWIITIPLSGAFAALVYTVVSMLSHVHVTVSLVP
jgi:inorganic phosphate transporter, PiT family